jgi:Zn-dependent protease
MFRSLKLGRLFGIPLYIHWTFWILPLWVILAHGGAAPLFFLAVMFTLFGCVVLHELGHAMAARAFGIRTRDITLYPIGGVARLERMSEKPGEELAIAVAGPAVNIVLAGAFTLLWVLGAIASPTVFPQTILSEFLRALIDVNIWMMLFNMIPAFPLDGGRVFRALLCFFLDRLRATRVAVYGGMALTVILVPLVLTIWPDFASPLLIVIAFFLFSAGQAELAALEHRERLRRAATPFGMPPNFAGGEVPSWMQPNVTVYVKDPETGAWVRQKQRHESPYDDSAI